MLKTALGNIVTKLLYKIMTLRCSQIVNGFGLRRQRNRPNKVNPSAENSKKQHLKLRFPKEEVISKMQQLKQSTEEPT